MKKLDTVRALILKAGRLDTPIEEARASALQAARLIVKHEFEIVTKDERGNSRISEEYEESTFIDFDESSFIEIEPFIHKVATMTMRCVKCGKDIRKGMTYMQESQVRPRMKPRVTHFECRRYFTEEGK